MNRGPLGLLGLVWVVPVERIQGRLRRVLTSGPHTATSSHRQRGGNSRGFDLRKKTDRLDTGMLLPVMKYGFDDVNWDAASCPATDYNLLYGDLSQVASHTLLGSECSLGTSGSLTWTGVPSGSLYFLVVGTDGAGAESSWGVESSGVERNGVAASGECGVSSKAIAESCP